MGRTAILPLLGLILVLVIFLFQATPAVAQTSSRIVEIPYVIFQGFSSNSPFPTQFYISADESTTNLAINEVVVQKNCIIELSGEASVPGAFMNSGDGSAIIPYGIFSSTTIFDVSNNSDFPCAGNVNIVENILIPEAPATVDVHVGGEKRLRNSFSDLSINSEGYLIDYSLILGARFDSYLLSPNASGLPLGFVTLRFIVEYTIEEGPLPDFEANALSIFQNDSEIPKPEEGEIQIDPSQDFEGVAKVSLQNVGSIEEVEYIGIVTNDETGNPLETTIHRLSNPSDREGETYLDFTIPKSWQLQPGSYKLTFQFDPDNKIEELEETNNKVSVDFSVDLPDLVITKVDIAQTVFNPSINQGNVDLVHEKPATLKISGNANGVKDDEFVDLSFKKRRSNL